MSSNRDNVTELTADIVSAYIGHNNVRAGDLPALIGTVHAALSGAGATPAKAEKTEPPMPWKKAIRPDYIVSFEDGKHYKSMKRHLTVRGITPAQYREKWGLPNDFPMVAPNYAKARSEMAKRIGLGQTRKGKTGTKKRAARKAA